MMTVNERILAQLSKTTGLVCDDCLTKLVGLTVRQQTNQACGRLQSEGKLFRKKDLCAFCQTEKLVNWIQSDRGTKQPPKKQRPKEQPMSEEWFWEGNVQSVIAAYLADNGWLVEHVSDTQRRERGVDIRATRERITLLVEVKGYPSVNYQRGPQQGQPKRANPLLQSKHWYAEALLAVILLQAAEPDARAAIGLPEVPRYLSLLEKTKSALKTLDIIVYLVNEQGHTRSMTA